ncbi:hypothetical protein, partial [Enterococcus larvae]|uniref:hypothetical protein n=1 Tax=Enterococcus larvae TaxID=2794352 RepID=UPI003F33341E
GSKSKEIREAHGEKETERRKNKPDFDIDHQNQTCFLFESRLLSHSRFLLLKFKGFRYFRNYLTVLISIC